MNENLQGAWNAMTLGQKVSFALLGLAVLALVAVAVSVVSRPDYVVLYSNLDPKDGGAVVAKLQELNVPYRLSAGGTTVEVPANRVDQARLDLASAGLPAGSKVDFGIFDKVSFGATERVQKINYRRALEGELSRTISAMKQVSAADVRIDQPEPSLFVEEEKPTVAAVVLSLIPGTTLSSAQVASIVHIVSHSVAGLEPQNVFVTDTDLRPLSDGSEFAAGDLTGVSLRHFERKRELEKAEAGKLQSVLDKAFGPGATQVQVTLDMDFTQKDETRTEYTQPKSTAGATEKISEQTFTEEYAPSEGGAATPSGPAGTPSNLGPAATGGAPTSAAIGKQPGYRQTQTTTNYLADETTVHESAPPGKITKRSVAVLLDSEKAPDTGKVEELAKATLGIDTGTGDQISVVSMKFDKTWQEEQRKAMEATEKQGKKAATMATVKLAGKVVGLIALGFLFLRWAAKGAGRALSMFRQPAPAVAAGGAPPAAAAGREGAGRPQERAEPEDLSLEQRVNRGLEAVAHYARTKPDAAAMLLRSWLAED
jgi:flagellar M-ring protein FliF